MLKAQRGERSRSGAYPDRLIKRDGRGPAGVRFKLHFAPAGVPSGTFQAGHQQPADPAPSKRRIDQQPMNDRHRASRRPARNRERNGANNDLRVAGGSPSIATHVRSALHHGLSSHFDAKVGRFRPSPNCADVHRPSPDREAPARPAHHRATQMCARRNPGAIDRDWRSTNCLRKWSN